MTESDRLLFEFQNGVFRQLMGVDSAGKPFFTTTTPTWKQDARPSPDGEWVAFREHDTLGREALAVQSLSVPHSCHVSSATPDLRGFNLGRLEEVHWDNEGLTLAGMLLTPTKETGHRPPFPLVVDVHGAGPPGPKQAVVTRTLLEWQFWAANGYCVFAPDYRSSGIYGWDPIKKTRDSGRFNRVDAEDILAGVAMLVEQGIADTERAGIVGHSHGAFLVNWILTMIGRFKAAVSYEGQIEWHLNYGVGGNIGGNAVTEEWFGGKPWEKEAAHRANSPIFDLPKVTTPTLLVLGREETPTYPMEYMFTVLRCLNVETQLLIYEKEGHMIAKPENQRDLLQRVYDLINQRVAHVYSV